MSYSEYPTSNQCASLCIDTICELANKFIKSVVIKALKESSQLFCELDVSLSNQKPDYELFFDYAARQKLIKLLIEDIDESECNRFYGTCI